MPTKKPRLMLTIPPELAHALDEFREATGTSPASFVTSLLVEALPMIQSLTKAARLAKQNNAEALDVFSETVADALCQVAGVQRDLLEHSHKIRRAAGKQSSKKRKPAND